MKMKHIFLLVLVGFIVFACTPGVGTTVVKTKKKFDITFKVKDIGGVNKLEIKEKNRGCKNTPANNKGCMRVPKDNSGEITFGFISTMNFPCSTNANSWFISKIELANIEGGFGQPVNAWIVSDFGANALTGVVWERAAGQEVAEATIVDNNDLSGVVYYQITAESCDTHESITSDPRVINEGGKSVR